MKYVVQTPEKKRFKRSLYVDVGFGKDGSVNEMFLVFDRDGPMNEMLEGLGIAISIALQCGTPATELADSLRGFEPHSIMWAVADALKTRHIEEKNEQAK